MRFFFKASLVEQPLISTSMICTFCPGNSLRPKESRIGFFLKLKKTILYQPHMPLQRPQTLHSTTMDRAPPVVPVLSYPTCKRADLAGPFHIIMQSTNPTIVRSVIAIFYDTILLTEKSGMVP